MGLQPTDYFSVSQPNGICKTFQTIILFLFALWVPTAICSLTLGSSGVRRKLGMLSEWHGKEPYGRRFVISILGSFLLHVVVWNVTIAAVLNGDNDSEVASFTNLYWIWFIRPMPATFVLFLSWICPPLFIENALEMQLVEGLMGIFTIGIYDDLRIAVGTASDWSFSNSAQKLGFERIRDGSKVGVGFWSIGLVVVLVCLSVCAPTDFYMEKNAKIARAVFFYWSILFNFVRMVAGFAIWSGVPMFDPSSFCPSLDTTGTIAAISVSITIMDHLLRALFCVGRVDWLGSEAKSWQLGEGLRSGYPLDLTAFKFAEGELDGVNLEALGELKMTASLRLC